MLKTRTIKTSSGSTAVQVVEYHQGNRKIISHIGSAKNDKELLLLKQKAADWITDNNKQLSLFDNNFFNLFRRNYGKTLQQRLENKNSEKEMLPTIS